MVEDIMIIYENAIFDMDINKDDDFESELEDEFYL